jgi:2-phospho-L-lactate guanylyltransferase
VLVPVNRLDRAKGRLAELLTPAERVELAEATLLTVVAAAQDAGFALAILTADRRVGDLVGTPARMVAEDPALRGLNAQIEAAIAVLDVPSGGLLIVHADLPLATGAALRSVVSAAAPAPSATLVRSGDGGTNAMLLRPPGRCALAYGRGSFALHRAAAEAAGMEVRAVEVPELALDLDTPADLDALLAHPGGTDTRAGRLLVAWRIAERLAAA